MSISGIGSYAGFAASAFGAGSGGTQPAASAGAAGSTDSSSDALQYLIKYMNESPAQRMEEAWLAKHHLSEQSLQAMSPDQQDAIRKQMAEDIKKQIQEKTGGLGGNANVVV
jgi:hypothetical protein